MAVLARGRLALDEKTTNQIEHILTDSRCFLKHVSVVPSFSRESNRILRVRIHVIPAIERRVLNVRSRHKRPMEAGEEESLLQAGLWRWI